MKHGAALHRPVVGANEALIDLIEEIAEEEGIQFDV